MRAGPAEATYGRAARVKTIFQIFLRDVKRLLRNPVAMVIVIGISVIPGLYAWYNIVVNWDPYSNTVGVKVAVANNDEGTSNDMVGQLNAGQQVIDQLKQNHELGWTFTDEQSAVEGVKAGDYYAAIVIPKDFSANLTSMLTGDFKQPQLVYYSNEKKNAIAPKVTDTGASTIQQTVNQTFVGTVGKTVADMAKKAGAKAGNGADRAAGSASEDVARVRSSIDATRAKLKDLTGTIDTASQSVDSSVSLMETLGQTVPLLQNSLKQGTDLLTTTRAAGRDVTGSLSNTLASSMGTISSTSAQANASIGQMAGTITAAQGSVDESLRQIRVLTGPDDDSYDAAAASYDTNRDGDQAYIDQLVQKHGVNGYAIIWMKAHKNDLPGTNHEDTIDSMVTSNEALKKSARALETQSADLKQTVTDVTGASNAIDQAVQQGVGTLGDARTKIDRDAAPKLSAGLDGFSDVAGDLQGALGGLTPAIAQTKTLAQQLKSALAQSKQTVSTVSGTLQRLSKGLDGATTDLEALRSSESMAQLAKMFGLDPEQFSEFVSSPVKLQTEALYPVGTYGAGVAPFYTNLALWVGGIVLVAILKLEVDREGIEGKFTPSQAYIARGLLFSCIGLIQGLIICVGDIAMGLQMAQPGLFVLAGLVGSFVYVNLVYALASAFKHIGKAIAVVLVIMQIPGSSGMYPIEMMPSFFRGVYPLLPFTYGINAMRECIAGMYGANYWLDLLRVLLFLPLALLVGLALRPYMLNLNLLFDKKLRECEVMICEENGMARERFRLRTIFAALYDSAAFRGALVKRARAFERDYARNVARGFVIVVAVPLVTLVGLSLFPVGIEVKIWLLVAWIAIIIAVCTYLIWLEYAHESLEQQIKFASMDDTGMRAEALRHLSAGPWGGHSGSAVDEDRIPSELAEEDDERAVRAALGRHRPGQAAHFADGDDVAGSTRSIPVGEAEAVAEAQQTRVLPPRHLEPKGSTAPHAAAEPLEVLKPGSVPLGRPRAQGGGAARTQDQDRGGKRFRDDGNGGR